MRQRQRKRSISSDLIIIKHHELTCQKEAWLLSNHLTMSLFHHAAIWPENPEFWPQGFYVNGHMLIDSEKMSKSTGNFLSLREAIDQYSADATRIALADAGDAIDDANFERATAVSALMRLYLLIEFAKEITSDKRRHAIIARQRMMDDEEEGFFGNAYRLGQIMSASLTVQKLCSQSRKRSVKEAEWRAPWDELARHMYATKDQTDDKETLHVRWVSAVPTL